MLLKCLGSSSTGNCYILESDTEALIIEVGISLKEVKKALDFNISKVTGVVVSHFHADHSKYLKDFYNTGIPCACTKDTIEKFDLPRCIELENKKPFQFGNFKITPFDNVHSVPCFGFLIEHEDIGRLLFATDTEYIKYRFKNLSHMMIEANYDNELINNYDANRDHVLTGHMEIKTTIESIIANDNPNLRNIVLMHLSDSNSNQTKFKKQVKEVTKYAEVYVAEKGMEPISLDLVPF